MIALTWSEKKALREEFPERCLKATPDPEFLSNLYDYDISMCPHRLWEVDTPLINQIFTQILDPISSSSRVPELLVWMQGQVRWTIVILFTFIDTFIETS
jgi:hypothetical protein